MAPRVGRNPGITWLSFGPGEPLGVKEECLTDKSKSLALCFDSWEEARAAADEHCRTVYGFQLLKG